MDELKPYGRNPDQLDGLLHTVRTFSDVIRIKFGLEKCAMVHFVNGKLSRNSTGVTVRKTETIKGLEPGQVYKYLGVDESNGIEDSTMRERLRREYFCTVKMALRTELYGRNKVLAIIGLASAVLASFTGGPRTCSSLIGEPGSSTPCMVSTILQQTWTGCKLLRLGATTDRSNVQALHCGVWLLSRWQFRSVYAACIWVRLWKAPVLDQAYGSSLYCTDSRGSV